MHKVVSLDEQTTFICTDCLQSGRAPVHSDLDSEDNGEANTEVSSDENNAGTGSNDPLPERTVLGVSTSTHDAPVGWPTLDADQQGDFQNWYVSGMAAKKEVLLKAVHHLQQQTELEDSRGAI